MTDNIIKSLKWLIFNFPKIENPKDDVDKISNCIHLYCQNAIDELYRQKAEIERLQKTQVKEIHIDKDFYNECLYEIKRAKSEAIKEFGERFEEHVNGLTGCFLPQCGFMVSLDAVKNSINFNVNKCIDEMEAKNGN